jgi:hypothetical protein
MQCNVEFGYQLSIRSGTKENHGKPRSSWPVAGPSHVKTQLTSIGLSVPRRKHITSPLQALRFNVIYGFVTMIY